MITIIFIEDQNAGNVGAICRSMANFGLDKLIVINPKCDIYSEESRNRAKHAQHILNGIKVYPSIIAMKEKESFDYIVGSTGTLGSDYNIPRVPITPKQFAEKIREHPDLNVAFLIGREGDGLTNEEILECDFLVNIPTSLEYPVMNASHAASIIFYELFQSRDIRKSNDHIASANEIDKKVLLALVEEIIEKTEFATEEKRETQRKLWKRLVGKSFLTKRESQALIGFLKKMKD